MAFILLLMLWVVVVVASYCAEGLPCAAFMGIVIGIILAGVFCVVVVNSLDGSDFCELEKYSCKIESIEKDSFVIGLADDELVVYYSGRPVKEMFKCLAKEANIIETDEDVIPRVEWSSGIKKTSGWVAPFDINSRVRRATKYDIYVPKGTVIKNIELRDTEPGEITVPFGT